MGGCRGAAAKNSTGPGWPRVHSSPAWLLFEVNDRPMPFAARLNLTRGDGALLKLDRRKALGLSVATVAALKMAAARSATSQQPLFGDHHAERRSSYQFSESQGTNLGDFVSSIGGFTQGCVRATASGCPLTVFFSPDRTSDRAEVVFRARHALQWHAAKPRRLFGDDRARRARFSPRSTCSAHYWFCRWRWQSAPRPVVGQCRHLDRAKPSAAL